MSTDLSLAPLDMIFGYSLRFKIEVLFKQAIHQVGTFTYRFWLEIMVPRKRGNASRDWKLHFSPEEFKACVRKKINAYHLFMQLGFIAQGLMKYLSIHHHKEVWRCFGSWLCTIRADTLPSEKVVALSLNKTYIHFSHG